MMEPQSCNLYQRMPPRHDEQIIDFTGRMVFDCRAIVLLRAWFQRETNIGLATFHSVVDIIPGENEMQTNALIIALKATQTRADFFSEDPEIGSNRKRLWTRSSLLQQGVARRIDRGQNGTNHLLQLQAIGRRYHAVAAAAEELFAVVSL